MTTSTYSIPAVRGSDTFAATTVTLAPRRCASSASANPMRPRRAVADEADGVDRLARAARGDEHVRAIEFARRRGARSRSRPAAPAAPAAGRFRTPRATPAGPSRVAEPSRRARAASRGWPAWPDARTSRCSWPERRSSVAGTRAPPRSAGCRRGRARAWPASARTPARRCRRRRGRPARGARAARARAAGRPGTTPRSGSGSHSVTSTGAPVMPANVAGPTKRVAASVWTTRTLWPGLQREPRELDRLIGRDPAAHTEEDARQERIVLAYRYATLPVATSSSAIVR